MAEVQLLDMAGMPILAAAAAPAAPVTVKQWMLNVFEAEIHGDPEGATSMLYWSQKALCGFFFERDDMFCAYKTSEDTMDAMLVTLNEFMPAAFAGTA